MADPASYDNVYEYVQFITSERIDFSETPYTVIICNNGTILRPSGWLTGSTLTYAIQLDSGVVEMGETFYLGGPTPHLNGPNSEEIAPKNWFSVDCTEQEGAGGIGIKQQWRIGMVGNGGPSADGIAVFAGRAEDLTEESVPLDCVFYGDAVGDAAAYGYRLTDGSLLNEESDIYPSPGKECLMKFEGVYNYLEDKWVTKRTSSSIASFSEKDFVPAIKMIPYVFDVEVSSTQCEECVSWKSILPDTTRFAVLWQEEDSTRCLPYPSSICEKTDSLPDGLRQIEFSTEKNLCRPNNIKTRHMLGIYPLENDCIDTLGCSLGLNTRLVPTQEYPPAHLRNCPSDTILYLPEGRNNVWVELPAPEFDNPCGEYHLTSNFLPDSLAEGTYAFEFILEDDSAKAVDSCITQVWVKETTPAIVDTIPPVIPEIPDTTPVITDTIPPTIPEIPDTTPAIVDTIPPMIPEIPDTTPAIVDTIPPVIPDIPDTTPAIVDTIPPVIPDIPDTTPVIVDTIPTVIPNIPDTTPAIVDSIPPVIPEIPDTTPTIVDTIPPVIPEIPEIPDTTPAIVDTIPPVIPEIPDTTPAIVDTIPPVIPDIPDTTPAIVDTIPPVIPEIPKIPDTTPEIADTIPPVIPEIPDTTPMIVDTIPPVIPDIPDTTPVIVDTIPPVIPDIPDTSTVIVDTIPPVIPEIPDTTPTIVDTIPSVIPDIPDTTPAIVDTIPPVIPEIPDTMPAIVDSIPPVIPEIPDTTPTIVDTIPSVIPEIPEIPDTTPVIVDTIPPVIPDIPDTTPAIVDTLPPVIPEIPDTTPTIVDTIPPVIPEIPDTTPVIVDTIPPVIPDIPDTTPAITDTIPPVIPNIPDTTPAIVDSIPPVIPEIPDTTPVIVDTIPSEIPEIPNTTPVIVDTVPEIVENDPDIPTDTASEEQGEIKEKDVSYNLLLTPNGDGINDRLEIESLSQYPDNEIHIYNQWGIQVFHMKHYDNSWGGDNHNGFSLGGRKRLPVGTYYYLLLSKGSKALSGFIELSY